MILLSPDLTSFLIWPRDSRGNVGYASPKTFPSSTSLTIRLPVRLEITRAAIESGIVSAQKLRFNLINVRQYPGTVFVVVLTVWNEAQLPRGRFSLRRA